ncbi:hypothetical protein WA026_010807 [Henosepilachna vigintioctopunctata]|uniref:TGF-beta family profile domain-containing protein n=1 Tax=Henosepilachna vigintioctopunctata TaxID=420089 RepID=A0AAW1UW09_9CUCU
MKIENKTNKKKVKCHVSKFMLEIYENNKTGFNSSSADVVRSVIPKQANTLNGKNLVENFSDSHILIFDLPRTSMDEIFINAELKILTLIDTSEATFKGVEKMLSLSVYDETQQQFVNAHVLHIRHKNDTWLSFNLTTQVSKILNSESRSKNLKVAVKMSSLVSMDFEQLYNIKLSLLPSSEDIFDHDYPILILSYLLNSSNHKQEITNRSNEQLNIKKRSIDEDYEEETNSIWDEIVSKKIYSKKLKRIRNTCNRKPLYINFADINYDEWIVQPSGYEAFQCQGKCFYPVAEHLSPTKHAIVQALLHSVAPSRASRSCCVPTSLDSISILYVDNNGVLTYRYAYRDMVVLECGCR